MSFERSNWRPTRRSADGQRLCRWCGGTEFEKRRHVYCSDRCEQAFYIANSSARARRALWKRDHEICALCGVDCAWLKQFFETRVVPKGYWRRTELAGLWLHAYGIPLGRATTDWWDADHIVPVIKGGGQCGLENLRTLCIPCHQRETAKLRREISIDRKDDARPLLALMGEAPSRAPQSAHRSHLTPVGGKTKKPHLRNDVT